MNNIPEAARPLAELTPQHDFFVGVDSDGCAFDSMEIKHKECFIPNTIKYWGLQAVSKYAREAAEFVNLYSKWRGINRWPALVMVFDLLRERTEVVQRNVDPPAAAGLRAFMDSGLPLSNEGLEQYMADHKEPDLKQGLDWSLAVNATVADLVHGVPPFPLVRDSLEMMSNTADIVVVSATPCEALDREWAEHGIAPYCRAIAGQEMGTKTEHLALAAGSRYPEGHVLMIGDAPGDLRAARANDALFYPINPGQEEASWRRFYDQAYARFAAGTYAGEYEAGLIAEFEALLPDTPPWKA
jgi:phosphoglycolate phosphatase-like HAD superfamily hydrolase